MKREHITKSNDDKTNLILYLNKQKKLRLFRFFVVVASFLVLQNETKTTHTFQRERKVFSKSLLEIFSTNISYPKKQQQQKQQQKKCPIGGSNS